MVQVRTRHTPSAGVARLVLAPGELVQVEAGAMMATSYHFLSDIIAGALLGLLVTAGACRCLAPPDRRRD